MAERSRTRRWMRRIAYTVLAVPLAAAVGLAIYLWTGHPESFTREKMIQAMARALGRPVVVESVSLRYLPPAIVVRGFRTSGPRIEVARAEATLSVRAFLRGQIVVKDLDLWDPVLEWETDTDRFLPARSPGAAPPPAPGGLSSRFDLRRLRIRGGTVIIGSQRRAVSAEVEGLELHADNTAFGFKGPFEGTAVFHRGRFVLGDLQLSGLDGSVSFEADRDSVRTKRLRLKASGVDIRGSGQVQPGTPVRGRFDALAHLDPQGPSLRRPLPQFGAKDLTCDVDVILSAEGVKVNGSFLAAEPTIDADRRRRDDGTLQDGPAAPWPAARGVGTFTVGPGRIEVSGTLEEFAGGAVEGKYVGVKYGSTDEAERRHEVSISATGLRLDQVLDHFDLPGDDAVPPSARVSGQASLRWTGSRIDQMAGAANATFEPVEGGLPLSGVATAHWRGARVTVESSSLEIPGSVVELAGVIDGTTVPMDLDLTAQLSSDRPGPLASFLERRFPALARHDLRPTDLGGRVTAHIGVQGSTARPEVRASFESDGLEVSVPALAGSPSRPGGPRAHIPIVLTSAAGDVTYSPDLLRLDLRRAEGAGLSAQGQLSVQPERAEILSVDLDAPALPAALLARLAGVDPERLPAGGTLGGSIHLAGGNGSFTLEGEKGSLAGSTSRTSGRSPASREAALTLTRSG